MKKTLITLLALAGLSSAATVNDALFGITNYTGASSTIDIKNTETTLNVTDSTKDGYVEINGMNFARKGSNRTYITLTFVVDLSLLTTPEANTAFILDNVKWGSVLTTDRTFKGAWNDTVWTSNGSEDARNYQTSALGSTGTAVLTFNTGWLGTGQETDGTQCASQVYLNGELISGEKGTGLSHGSDVNKIYINEAFTGAIKEMYVHNEMLRGADVKTLYNSIMNIPEPTTATLSLLALCGLAARRRRH